MSNNFIIGLTDVPPDVTAPTLWNYDVCGQYPGAVGDGATVYLKCDCNVPPRRYLIVQMPPDRGHLNFCEISVYIRSKYRFNEHVHNSHQHHIDYK